MEKRFILQGKESTYLVEDQVTPIVAVPGYPNPDTINHPTYAISYRHDITMRTGNREAEQFSKTALCVEYVSEEEVLEYSTLIEKVILMFSEKKVRFLNLTPTNDWPQGAWIELFNLHEHFKARRK